MFIVADLVSLKVFLSVLFSCKKYYTCPGNYMNIIIETVSYCQLLLCVESFNEHKLFFKYPVTNTIDKEHSCLCEGTCFTALCDYKW